MACLAVLGGLLLLLGPSRPPAAPGDGQPFPDPRAEREAYPPGPRPAPVLATAAAAISLSPGRAAEMTPHTAAVPKAAPAVSSGVPSARMPTSSAPDFSEPAPAAVMENLRGAFRLYSSRFGGNPVGTNPEITKALSGGNPKQAVFLQAEDGLRVNDRGELIDPWGTPFFLHQLSGAEMEIHSAGPDRVLWTGDDLVTK
jgi:hypothetical protein